MNIVLLLVASLGAHGQAQTGQIVARYKNLAVYPIYEPLGTIKDSDYITLDEGLKAGTVTVSERGATPIIRVRTPNPPTPPRQEYQGGGGGAEVNTLWLTNKSGKRLVLLSGEMVRGGQQDRIIGKDAIIASTGKPIDLGVYCVEHGRWNGSKDFGAAPASAAIVAPQVRKSAQYSGDQQKVWNGVAMGGAALQVASPSSAYRDIANDKAVAKQTDDYFKEIQRNFASAKATGVAVAINGKMVWVDRFSSTTMFQKYWPRLLRSYAMEAMTTQERTPSTPPKWQDALNFAHDRSGKQSYEVSEFQAKLTKIESATAVVFRLDDLGVKPMSAVHENKVLKD